MKRIIRIGIIVLLFICFVNIHTVYAGYTKGTRGKEDDRTTIVFN